jgi:hypothetical protein
VLAVEARIAVNYSSVPLLIHRASASRHSARTISKTRNGMPGNGMDLVWKDLKLREGSAPTVLSVRQHTHACLWINLIHKALQYSAIQAFNESSPNLVKGPIRLH